MVEYKLEAEQIETICQELKSKYKSEWDGKDEKTPTLKFTDKIVKGTIKFNDMKLNISGASLDKKFKVLLDMVKKAEKNKIKENELENSPFKKLLTNEDYYNGLSYNKTLIKKIETVLKKFNIGEIKSKESFNYRHSFFSDYVAISMEGQIDDSNRENAPSGFYTRLKTFLMDKYPMKEYEKETFSMVSPYFLPLLQKEKSQDIKIYGTKVGVYYPERNFIHLYYNPFAFQAITIFSERIPKALLDLFKAFTEIKVKKNNITNIQRRLLIESFASKSKEKERSLKANIKSQQKRVSDYGNSIRTCIETIHSDTISLDFIKSLMTSSGEQLFDEIDKIKALPFVKKVAVDSGDIDILFKETCMPIPNMKRGDTAKGVGKRFIYIGEVGFKISPGNFTVYGNCPMINGHPHPHGGDSTDGQNSAPCFGDGDGHSKIYSLLAEYKFTDLTRMLWLWIKTYRNEGAYVKVWHAYDDRLAKGYPVFDDKGKRIKINDPTRIKTGEQITLKAESMYKANIEKYKYVKLWMEEKENGRI